LFDTGWFKRTCELVPDRRERWEIVVGHWSRSAQLFPADTIRHATIVDSRNATFEFLKRLHGIKKSAARRRATQDFCLHASEGLWYPPRIPIQSERQGIAESKHQARAQPRDSNGKEACCELSEIRSSRAQDPNPLVDPP
jgi:hypothetical protein